MHLPASQHSILAINGASILLIATSIPSSQFYDVFSAVAQCICSFAVVIGCFGFMGKSRETSSSFSLTACDNLQLLWSFDDRWEAPKQSWLMHRTTLIRVSIMSIAASFDAIHLSYQLLSLMVFQVCWRSAFEAREARGWISGGGHRILCALVGLVFPGLSLASALSFANSNWIWPTTNDSRGAVTFRKDFTPPPGKSPIGAEVIMAAASYFFLYVNGNWIGGGADGPGIAQRFCVALEPGFNVFAGDAGAETSSRGGLIATILVTYSDLTTDTIVSDGTWRFIPEIPPAFQELSFDDTAWPRATVVGAYGNAQWGTVSIPSNPPVLGLASSYWMWTDVVAAGTWPNLPASQRAFRRTFTPAQGQIPVNANILITADDLYTLYVNGVQVGTGGTWTRAQHYVVNFASAPTKIVVAVLATNANAPSPAGLLFSMEINMAPPIASPATRGQGNCTAGEYIVSDNQWHSTVGAIPNGFEQPGFDDSTWDSTVEEALYGGGAWGTIVIDPPSAPVII
ncbi:hypothetical protein MSAN_01800600 [Mycena sanguinolenta]|uniref:Glycoside hydrolase family 78 protein n=1 Tax=Mycena sanguinolenta TaxID=230812 RepID=A0A8H7CSM4_9AGAR|nr:hypothetical protein MSAN_01800600 [Mycena sanguinolenta]